jgi:ribosomal protein S18 acetylase RimI-like enzyme
MTPEIAPFAEEHLPRAAVLLADRHRRHRAAEPTISAAYEDADAAGAEIGALLRSDGARGVVALRDGRVAGYLIGTARDEAVWGPNGWVEHAAHAATDPEDVRDLYAVVAQEWVDAGRKRHFALVPASDAGLVDAWFRLSFGQQQVYAAREVDASASWPAGVRPAELRDVDAILALAPLVEAVQNRAPTFAVRMTAVDMDELRADIEDEVRRDDTASLLYEVDGAVAGSFLVMPVEASSSVVGLARAPGHCYLAWAATIPAVRGTGAGLALMQAADAWAHEAGYTGMTIDWRAANLLASRFWQRRGFRPTFLRLSRII